MLGLKLNHVSKRGHWCLLKLVIDVFHNSQAWSCIMGPRYYLESNHHFSYISQIRKSYCLLSHWGRAKSPAILQTAFSNAFSWMKMYQFRLTFHWSYSNIGLNNELSPTRRQTIIWTSDGKFTDAHMRHSASMRYLWNELHCIYSCSQGLYYTYKHTHTHIYIYIYIYE